MQGGCAGEGTQVRMAGEGVQVRGCMYRVCR